MTTFTIRSYHMYKLKNLIDRFNKKADKLGMPHLTYVEGETIKEWVDNHYEPFPKVEIIGQVPVIKGWDFLASIEHIDGVNIIKNCPGIESIPNGDYYRNRKPFCDHCQTHRLKKYSFLIRNRETGELMQVGRSCLKDFFAIDISRHLSYITMFNKLCEDFDDCHDEDKDKPNPKKFFIFKVEDIIAAAISAVRETGYRRSDDDYSTRTQVEDHFFSPMKEHHLNITEQDIENAKKAIEWALNNKSTTHFMITVRQIIKLGNTTTKYFGYLCGLIPTFQREMAKVSEIRNEHFGIEKKRMELTLTLTSVQAIESYYGISYLHKFLDPDNRIVVWFASKEQDIPLKEAVKVKATIKGHTEYNGVKQTQVTRLVRQ